MDKNDGNWPISCRKCGSAGTPEEHTCPYSTEIYDDYESLCSCCLSCQQECAWDV